MNNTIEILTNHQTETAALLARCGHRRNVDGPKVNRRLRRHLAVKRFNVGMDFLAAVHIEIVEKNPTAFMGTVEAMDYLKGQSKHVDDGFDNSPCPIAEMADLDGVADASGILERALMLAGGNVNKLADVLEAHDKARSAWAGKGNHYDKRKPATVEAEPVAVEPTAAE
jgi:hypothetical protein